MSGLELAARLKEQRPSLRVIYMSGYPQEVITHQGLVTSELELIEKPFTREALLRAVAGALARDRLG
jgi:FixJ family two-component response regulator